jgi:hypothetical protein
MIFPSVNPLGNPPKSSGSPTLSPCLGGILRSSALRGRQGLLPAGHRGGLCQQLRLRGARAARLRGAAGNAQEMGGSEGTSKSSKICHIKIRMLRYSTVNAF